MFPTWKNLRLCCRRVDDQEDRGRRKNLIVRIVRGRLGHTVYGDRDSQSSHNYYQDQSCSSAGGSQVAKNTFKSLMGKPLLNMNIDISLTFKKDKPGDECSSYRTISLLNLDFPIQNISLKYIFKSLKSPLISSAMTR